MELLVCLVLKDIFCHLMEFAFHVQKIVINVVIKQLVHHVILDILIINKSVQLVHNSVKIVIHLMFVLAALQDITLNMKIVFQLINVKHAKLLV